MEFDIADSCCSIIFWWCGCKTRAEMGMVHIKDFSFYPKSKLVKQGRNLYYVTSDFIGCHIWQTMVNQQSPILVHRTSDDHMCTVFFAYVLGNINLSYFGKSIDLRMYFNPVGGVIFPVIYVWRIQQAMRRYLQRKSECVLAVMMGCHERLGGGSVITVLPTELVFQSILVYLK